MSNIRKLKAFENKISKLRERYFLAIAGKESLLKALNEIEIPEHVYNSNAIENSTLTLEETERILQQIDLDRFIIEREIFEARNLARVMEYVETKAQDKKLDREMILLLHLMLIKNIRDDIAGRFRQGDEWVRVGNYIAVGPEEIEKMITQLLTEYNSSTKSIVEKIARMHLLFEYIHPFVDGNGRIGRVLNNYLLLRENYVPINIRFLDRKEYYSAFQDFQHTGNTDKMENIVGSALLNSYFRRLAYLEQKKIVSLQEYAKSTKQSHANVINKAKRQTIEAFLEKGVWRIGV